VLRKGRNENPEVMGRGSRKKKGEGGTKEKVGSSMSSRGQNILGRGFGGGETGNLTDPESVVLEKTGFEPKGVVVQK